MLAAAAGRSAEMAQKALAAIGQTLSGIAAALRARWRIVWGVTAAVFVFNLVAPVAILSIVRKPVDFFTWNPWLSRLPEYLRSQEPLSNKLSFLSSMALAWLSSDNGGAGIERGFLRHAPPPGRRLLAS